VRKDNWKAIRFYNGIVAVRTELYDLNKDIGERNNIADHYPGMVKKLEAAMDAAHISSVNPLFKIK
jgi:hypothetical protein